MTLSELLHLQYLLDNNMEININNTMNPPKMRFVWNKELGLVEGIEIDVYDKNSLPPVSKECVGRTVKYDAAKPNDLTQDEQLAYLAKRVNKTVWVVTKDYIYTDTFTQISFGLGTWYAICTGKAYAYDKIFDTAEEAAKAYTKLIKDLAKGGVLRGPATGIINFTTPGRDSIVLK